MTGDEMQRAIEFLLRTQANFETRFEESNQNWNMRFEESNQNWNSRFDQTNQRLEALFEKSNQRVNTLFELANQRWDSRFEQSNQRWDSRLEESNRLCDTRFEETNRQIARTNHQLESLAETQAEFTKSMLRFITLQTEFNTWVKQKLGELTSALQRIQEEISDLTKSINSFMKFSSGNGGSPQE
jgi:hypothetical protein